MIDEVERYSRNCWLSAMLLLAALLAIPVIVACEAEPPPPSPLRVVTLYSADGKPLGAWRTRSYIYTHDGGGLTFYDEHGNRISVSGTYTVTAAEVPNAER